MASGTTSHETLVIVLSTVLGIFGLALIGFAFLWALRNRRRHRLFNRGLTPIGDDEIETWKVSRAEKEEEAGAGSRYTTSMPPHHQHASKDSTSSAKIQYQSQKGGGAGSNRPSTDAALSTRSYMMGQQQHHSFSLDLPRAPEPAVFARAPNARTGLTDETVPGDAPFVAVVGSSSTVKRQPSRLHKKLPPSNTHSPKNLSRASSRTRAARSNSHPEYYWNNSNSNGGSNGSSVNSSSFHEPGEGHGHNHNQHAHARIYSSSSIPPQISADEKDVYVGLSAPPSRRGTMASEVIGQAIG
ncbi:hypothetical protein F4777DRAFT_354208 [Nemania sp. FL0916]|nr:hypothetical protein F4777DRAFT_354208 [Nemania sp. FL0916]